VSGSPGRPDGSRASSPAAQAALAALLEGHDRYLHDRPLHLHQDAGRRTALARAQHPFAMILGCADSRVPPEVIFDQGFGDLFVIRTAGHVLDAAVLGSVEYGLEELKIPLVMVLGHERCGAVQAAVAAMERGSKPGGHLGALVDAIMPAVTEVGHRTGDAVDNAVRAHTRLVMDALQRAVPGLAARVQTDEVRIVGGRHDLDTGDLELLP
jgi:carbonic anhydrase